MKKNVGSGFAALILIFVYEQSMSAAMLNHWSVFQNLVPTLPTMQRTATDSFKLNISHCLG